jgi:ubiquinone/menaquinone biosynthesis C-methylase UbiE
MVSSPYGIFVGASNPFAPEVAIRRVAGWNYEENHKGGLEIWFGSPNHSRTAGPSAPLKETSIFLPRSQSIKPRTEENDEAVLENILSKFYRGSDFRHFGYWQVDIHDARTACENLMDEILAFIPEKKGTIIDIGCGLGATTQYLLRHFSADAVTGVATDKKALKFCQKKVPGVKFLYRKLPKLRLPDESINFVFWAKGFGKLCSRKKLLKECFRVLKSGGRLVCFDVVYATTNGGSIWQKFQLRERPVDTLDVYRDLLLNSGFQEIQLADVTAECNGGFRKELARYIGLKRLANEIDRFTFQDLETYLLKNELPVHQCLLLSGRKPVTQEESGQQGI